MRLPLVLVLVAVLPVPLPAQPRGDGLSIPAGRVLIDTVRVPGLEDNRLGDPSLQTVAVYLPPSYASAADRRYPVLYLLHGIGGSFTDWILPTYQGMTISTMLDTLIALDRSREFIVVMPNGRTHYGGSLYENSIVTGAWEDFIARDLVSHVDGRYRTIAARESRGIAGHSMGGYGTLLLGAKHADAFSAAYAMSPCCLDLVGDLGQENASWRVFLEADSLADLSAELQRRNLYPMAYLVILSALSPDTTRRPFPVAPPFRVVDGKIAIAEPAYSALRQRMYLGRLAEFEQRLADLRFLRFDYGKREEFSHITLGTARLSAELAARGVPHQFEVYDGAHRDRIGERLRDVVLPFFSAVLAFDVDRQ